MQNQESFESATLSNGLSVHVAHWPGKKWITSGFIVHSGARVDEVGLEGTAHFVEHLVSRNAERSYTDTKRFFESLGGAVMLGRTSQHWTEYTFFAPVTAFEEALRIFSSMLISAKLAKFVDIQRSVILQEYQRKWPLSISVDKAWRELKSLYHGVWLERSTSPLGTPESISRITEVALQGYYDRHYVPANISLVCVGGLSLQEVVAHLEQSSFASHPGGSRNERLAPVDTFPDPLENRYLFEVSKYIKMDKPVESGHYESTAVIPGTVKREVLRILSGMLDRVLFDEIRENRGWTYNTRSGWYSHQAFHEFSIKAEGLALESLPSIEDAVEELVSSLYSREDLFKDIQLRSIADSRMNDYSARALRDSAMSMLHGRGQIVTEDEYVAKLEAVTFSDILEALFWLKPNHRWTKLETP